MGLLRENSNIPQAPPRVFFTMAMRRLKISIKSNTYIGSTKILALACGRVCSGAAIGFSQTVLSSHDASSLP
jgi:hypothetical protein